MFPERKIYFCKMFPERKIFFRKMFPERKIAKPPSALQFVNFCI